MSREIIVAWLLIVAAGALVLRCPDLAIRPMHTDEAVNAMKLRELWEHGRYHYDPNEHHGPTLPYFSFLWGKMTGVSGFQQLDEIRLRALIILFGVGLILLLPLVMDGLGNGALLAAGVLTAVSPAMVFYSRYYIHEMLLVFFTALTLACGWRYARRPAMVWAVLTGVSVGLMQSTKETFVLPLAAMSAALVLNRVVNRQWNSPSIATTERPARPPAGLGGFLRIHYRHIFAAMAAWLIVTTLFFSSFFTHLEGVLDMVRTYSPWLNRAAGASPHLHPWFFYLERLTFFHTPGGPIWSEAFISAFALLGGVSAFTRRSSGGPQEAFVRFIALYTLFLTLCYSVIPYKTPWCLLGFWQGMILLAGAGVATALRQAARTRAKFPLIVLLLAGTGHLAVQAWKAGVTYCADQRNPYVYAQTSPNLLELAARINQLAGSSPEGTRLLIEVTAPGNDYWPLPWYLRAFDRVGWWAEIPPDATAPIWIVSTQFHSPLDAAGTHVMAGLFALRPGVFLELYVENQLWQSYLQSARSSSAFNP